MEKVEKTKTLHLHLQEQHCERGWLEEGMLAMMCYALSSWTFNSCKLKPVVFEGYQMCGVPGGKYKFIFVSRFKELPIIVV